MAQRPIDKTPQIIEQDAASAESAVATPVHSLGTVTNEDDFKEFVDKHIQTTTKFQSAGDLLKNSKPQMFLWFYFGIPAAIGLVAGGPLGALLFGLVFGHTARWIAGGIIRNRYIAETVGKFEGEIDFSDLLRFLNEHLFTIFRTCIHNRETPPGRVFFRRSAFNFFEIHQVFLQKFALNGEKIPRPFGIPRL